MITLKFTLRRSRVARNLKGTASQSLKVDDEMADIKYHCQNCGSEIKHTDTICPKCNKNLSEVGRHIEVTITEKIGLSENVKAVKAELKKEALTKKQQNIIIKGLKSLFQEIKKTEIQSITFGFSTVYFGKDC